jgi:hypothetical protein
MTGLTNKIDVRAQERRDVATEVAPSLGEYPAMVKRLTALRE